MVIYAAVPHFIAFAAGEVFFAICLALYSGSLEAWIVNTNNGSPEYEMQRFFQAGSIAGRLAAIVGGAVGGFAASYDLTTPWFLAALTFVLCTITALLFMADNGPRHLRERTPSGTLVQVINSISQGWHFIFQKRQLQALIASSLLVEFSMIAANLYWQPFFSSDLTNYTHLGLIGAAISAALMVGTAAAQWFTRLVGGAANVLIPMTLLTALSLGLAAFQINQWFAYVSFILVFVFSGGFGPAFRLVTNAHMTDGIRATLLSYQYMVGRIGASAGIFLLGWMADHHGIASAWLVGAIVMLLAVPLLRAAEGPTYTSHKSADRQSNN